MSESFPLCDSHDRRVIAPPPRERMVHRTVAWLTLALAIAQCPAVAEHSDNSTIVFRGNFTEPHWVA